jgi:glucosamine 6-phosphate synthetase-like amidotransferase/phosphosugar isomerase protein
VCQLAAYVGDRPIAPLLLGALEHQEPYLGASATGMAALKEDGIALVKSPGHVAHVKETTRIQEIEGTCAIAHSRLAFAPEHNTAEKTHPFLSDDGRFALMHNGVIKNHVEHWERLRQTHTFRSYSPDVDAITDSEVAIHMLSDAVDSGKSVPEALRGMAPMLTGSFLLGVISVEEPDTVYIANWHQPCYLALGDDEAMFVSSRAGLKEVKDEMTNIFQPPKNSLMKLTRGKVEITKLDPARRAPDLRLDMKFMGDRFVEALREKGPKTFLQMRREMHPEGLAEGYGIATREWEALRDSGVFMVNPFIDLVEALKREDRIVEYVDRRVELGIEGTPRFMYTLA